MTEKCKYCGWERPGGNYVHSRDACDDMREDALVRVVRAVQELYEEENHMLKHILVEGEGDKWHIPEWMGLAIAETLEALPENLRSE